MDELSFEEKLQYTKNQITSESRAYLINAKVEVSSMLRWSSDKVGIRVTGYIWGEYQPDISINYLPNWWQTFKATWLPKWLDWLCPVKCEQMMVCVKIIYPELKGLHQDQKLDTMKCVGITYVSREMIDDMALPILEDFVRVSGVLEHLKDFTRGVGQDSVTISYPSSGWQAFKSRWFSNWSSVHYCEKNILTAREVAPQLKISFPEEPHHIILSKIRPSEDYEF